ncbi:hypothetical protein HPB52_010051 [Rhipicephalus sanguineus]|uniref:Uncharacterized protein n=1 Tax=Rhipicephalus sanguineus TaxID=34632 RepID=A0A9D4PLX0_RHISA|nr:hypothetical protein HPB52_010051 [Rhipicephalus sanguineus]
MGPMLPHSLDARRTKELLFNINMTPSMVACNSAAPAPNMNTMNPARPPRPLLPKHQDTVKTYTRKLQGDYETERKAPGRHQASIKLDKSLWRVLYRRSTT